ncbi:MAG: HlyD family type I secretion periplasmic adaptor subunit [Rhizobiaceae bacterium]
MNAPVNQDIHWRANAKTDSNSIIRSGFWAVGVLFAVFLTWACLFPLSSAVITPGTFVSDGKNKLVQHQRGGRVQQIFVREGVKLEAGQPILALDEAQSQAELTQLEARHASLNALKARLDAERSGGRRSMITASVSNKPVSLRGGSGFTQSAKPVLTLRGGEGAPFVIGTTNNPEQRNPELIKLASTTPAISPDPTAQEFLQSQREAYSSGREVLARQTESLAKKVATLQKQKSGVLARVRAQQTMLKMNRREYDRLLPLARQGYVARNRLNERERAVLELEGGLTALKLDGEGIDNQIEEVRVQIKKARSEYANTAAREYAKIVSELAEISDQLVAARESVAGSTVRAPVTGVLTRLLATTVGGVVGAADLIGEIVPHDAPLVVQARVQPSDIDYVQIGQDAKIAVTAFNRRIDDTIRGRVTFKSADAEKDEKSGEPFFTVRLEIIGSEGKGRNRLSDIQAGMQSEIYINTGSRTFMTYLAKPLIDSFKRAFREQ